MTTPESGWVIEHRDSPAYAPKYWIGGAGWAEENLLAVRFARRIDAERVLFWLDGEEPPIGQLPHRVAEHGWG